MDIVAAMLEIWRFVCVFNRWGSVWACFTHCSHYAFVSCRFDPDWICNTSDDGGRYTYANQPSVVQWNCAKLGEGGYTRVRRLAVGWMMFERRVSSALLHYAEPVRARLHRPSSLASDSTFPASPLATCFTPPLSSTCSQSFCSHRAGPGWSALEAGPEGVRHRIQAQLQRKVRVRARARCIFAC